MTFGYAITSTFVNLFNYSGRASRKQFIIGHVIFTILMIPLSALVLIVLFSGISVSIDLDELNVVGISAITDIIGWRVIPLSLFLLFFLFGPAFALSVRRAHDLGWPTWLIVGTAFASYVIPFLSAIPGLWWLALPLPLFHLIGFVFTILFLFKRGNEGPNFYGPDPFDVAEFGDQAFDAFEDDFNDEFENTDSYADSDSDSDQDQGSEREWKAYSEWEQEGEAVDDPIDEFENHVPAEPDRARRRRKKPRDRQGGRNPETTKANPTGARRVRSTSKQSAPSANRDTEVSETGSNDVRTRRRCRPTSSGARRVRRKRNTVPT